MKLVKHIGPHVINPIITKMYSHAGELLHICLQSSVPSPFPWEGNMDRCCFWLHPPLKGVKRLFCHTPVTNKLMKLGCWLAFSLCVPIQLAVGPQSPKRQCCNASMIIIAAIIIKVSIALTGWVLLFSLRGKSCKVKHQSLSLESTRPEDNVVSQGCLVGQWQNKGIHWIINATHE